MRSFEDIPKYVTVRKSNDPKKVPVNANAFFNEDDISFYLLGAYMTDGNVFTKKQQVHFSFCSSDEDWIRDIAEILSPGKHLTKNRNLFTLKLRDMNVVNWLIYYGCTPRKSYTLKISNDIPKEYHKDFIRGAIDGDGCITYAKYTKTKKSGKQYHYLMKICYLYSASLDFLEQVKNMIPEHINCRIENMGMNDSELNGKKIIATTNMYRLIFSNSNCVKLLQWIYYDNHKLSLNRKRVRAEYLMLTKNKLTEDKQPIFN